MLLLRLDWLCYSLLRSLLLLQPLWMRILLMWLLWTSLTTVSLLRPHSHQIVAAIAVNLNTENKNRFKWIVQYGEVFLLVFFSFYLVLVGWLCCFTFICGAHNITTGSDHHQWISTTTWSWNNETIEHEHIDGCREKERERQTLCLPSRDIRETIICPLTGSISSADDLLKSRCWSGKKSRNVKCYWLWFALRYSFVFTSGIF